MRQIAINCAIAAPLIFTTNAQAERPSLGPGLEEIAMVDEVRVGFYEHAPRSLSVAMSKAVVSWCNGDRVSKGHYIKGDPATWLCGSSGLMYFRGVHANGVKGTHDLVCQADYGLKYLGMDLVAQDIAGGSCVAADFDGKSYGLHLNDADKVSNWTRVDCSDLFPKTRSTYAIFRVG